ncbi:MAG: thioredoxin family protein, partial [Desulfamplus sp.]|nr:thioredoxin family protein [Desulfamplus sp.]
KIAEEKKSLPGIGVGDNIVFNSVPQGKIFSVFLGSLSMPPISPETEEMMRPIEVPAELKLYISAHCPHCPGVAATLVELAGTSGLIHLKIIDGTLFTGEASRDGVLAAPCLILDNDFRWTGEVRRGEIINGIVNRDASRLDTAALRRVLEDGRAGWIAGKMMDKNEIFQGFIDLVTHDIWSVRLGAMVVIEELAADAPGLAAQMVPKLAEKFHGADTRTRGDILYALGEAGDRNTKEVIAGLVEGVDDPELAEAAGEALESIDERLGG